MNIYQETIICDDPNHNFQDDYTVTYKWYYQLLKEIYHIDDEIDFSDVSKYEYSKVGGYICQSCYDTLTNNIIGTNEEYILASYESITC